MNRLTNRTTTIVLAAGLAALTLHGAGIAQPASGVAKLSHAERYAPSVMPDRIVLTWSGDPKTTQSVTWRTSIDVPASVAEIAEADHGPGFAKAAKRINAATSRFVSDLGEANFHTATFTGLEPGRTYAYRVGDGTNFSAWNQFVTEPAEPGPFSFVYFGDAQNDLLSMWSRVTREAFREAPRAAFFLHAGDLVNRADADGEWGEWFEAGSFINATIPVIATPGNHEYVKTPLPDRGERRVLTAHFPVTFAFPDNGPSDLAETVYYVDYGDLRIISLNSNERQAEQVAWVDRVLSENDRRWTALTFHHPIYSTGKDRDNKALRDAWKPVFDRHAVDIVLTGHDHTYGRTGLVGPLEDGVSDALNMPSGRNAMSEAGTVYVVSVSGPKMYDANRNVGVDLVRRAEDTQLFQVITIDGDELRYEARTPVGAVYDAFTLRKRDGKPNELVEGVVTMPERRR